MQPCPCHNTTSTMFDTWCRILWILSCSIPFSSHQPETSFTWFHLSKESDYRTWEAFLDVFWRPDFSVLQCYQWLAPCCNPTVFIFMKHLLIVDFDSDASTFSRVFLISVAGVRGFFFTKERILHFSFILWSSRPCDIVEFTRMYQMYQTADFPRPNIFFPSLLDASCFVQSYNGLLYLHLALFGLHIGSSNQAVAKCQINTWYQRQTFYLLHLSWTKGIDRTWSINLFSVNCSNTYEPKCTDVYN